MVNSATITVGEINGYSWIRICGKGDVFLAPKLKKFTENLFTIESEDLTPKVVLDMEECTGMDSTFMGVLAGFAIKLKGMANSCFQLCNVSNRNQESLEELGIDSLVEINPAESEWKGQCETIQDCLKEWDPDKVEKKLPPSLILETHKTLGSLNKKNEEEFSSVIKAFEDKTKSSVTDRDS